MNRKLIVILLVFLLVGLHSNEAIYSEPPPKPISPDENKLYSALSHLSADSIIIELEELLKKKPSKEICDKANLELGKIAYAQGLYKKAYERLKGIDNDTAFFFLALSVQATGNDSSYTDIVNKIKEPALSRYFGQNKVVQEASNERFFLQFGAFDKYDKASRLCNKLKKIGLEPFIAKSNELYFVRTGPYSSNDDAELEGKTIGSRFIYKIVKE
jgi:hypothetical protein